MRVFPASCCPAILPGPNVSTLALPSVQAIFRSFVTELAVPPLSNGSPAQYIEPFTVIPVELAYVLTRQACDAPALPVESVQMASGYNATSPFITVIPVDVSTACEAIPKDAAPLRLTARGTG